MPLSCHRNAKICFCADLTGIVCVAFGRNYAKAKKDTLILLATKM